MSNCYIFRNQRFSFIPLGAVGPRVEPSCDIREYAAALALIKCFLQFCDLDEAGKRNATELFALT